jgi:hypothetical protein
MSITHQAYGGVPHQKRAALLIRKWRKRNAAARKMRRKQRMRR